MPFATAMIAELFGVEPEEVQEDFAPALARVYPEDLEPLMKNLANSAQTLEPWHDRFRVRHPRKGEIWLEGHSVPRAEPDGTTLWHGFLQDITQREKAEEEIKRQASLIRSLLDSIPDLIFHKDLNGVYMGCNPAFATFVGRSREEIIDRTDLDLFPKEVAEFFRQSDQEMLRLRESRHNEEWIKYPDGREVLVDTLKTPYLGPDGNIIGILGISRDITERTRGEMALRESERLLHTVIDLVPHFIFAKDLESRHLFVNKACAAANGLTPEEMVGKCDLEFLADRAQAEAFMRDDREVIESGRPKYIAEEKLTNSAGQIRVLQTLKVPFSAPGGGPAVMGVAVDVTELKRAEAALLFHKEVLQETGRIAKVGGWDFDPSTGKGFWTEEVARIHDLDPGLPITPEIGLTYYDSESRPRIQEAFRLALEQAQPYDLELRIISAKGVPRWVRTIGRPVLEQGRVVRVVGSMQDITEIRQLEAQLRQAQKLEAVGQLAGGIAHDFNNILAAILIQLDLLKMDKNLDKATIQALEDLRLEAHRAVNLTRHLLMFSRRSVLSVKPLDLNQVIANLLKMLRRLIGENIELRFESQASLASVRADAGMIEQVLMNLVVNARDALRKGGGITISTSAAELSLSQVTANPSRRPGHFVCLAVADNGCGMDADVLKRIFEPFFTTKEAGKGTGLGLATVHGIVAQHKGWVEVESEPGVGTTFKVFLPATEPSDALAAPASASAMVPRGHETILLVEDEARVRRLVGQTLRLLGYAVHEAANGPEALEVWRRLGSEVDLLLTDMVMPQGMTGLELTEKLQALKPGLRAIISSGYSAEIAQAGVPHRTGIVYLPKPYEAKVLAHVVRNCLDSRS